MAEKVGASAGVKSIDLTADYAKSGFGNRIGFGRSPALIVVDMVQAYFEKGAPLYAEVEAELAVSHLLIASARQSQIPVVFTRVEYLPGGADGGYFYQKVAALSGLERGSPLGAFAAGISPEPDDIIVTKQYPSSFFGTSLAATLNAMGVDTCLICGLTTSGCVRATALDALQNGFRPVVIPDACGDRDPGVQKANIFDLGQKYADIVPSADVMTWMRSR